MYKEMMRNIESGRVAAIKDLLDSGEWYDIAPNPVSALILWAEQVRPGGEWDHKPVLEEKFNL